MSRETIKNPKVFISYSWSSPDYQEWVVEIAKRLVSVDGIDVVIDVWDLVEGQDKYVFMEQMVKSEEIDKVLIFCDKKYKEKADQRSGGVGDETQIISSSVYKDVKQEKFIPIVTKRDEDGISFVPSYIESRIYIDLSNEDIFEENYERLVRNIHRAPLYQKPKLGNIPTYITEREIDHFQTSVIIKRMTNLIDKQPGRLKALGYDFTEKFIEELEQIVVEKNEGEAFHESIYRKIDELTPLKKEYLAMLKLLCDSEMLESDYLIEFFERLYVLTEFQGSGSYDNRQFDHIKFLFMELYLHTIRVLTKEKKYNLIAEMVKADYHVQSHRKDILKFDSFYFYLTSLEQRNNDLNLRKYSLQADLMYQRAEKFGQELAEADLLLYYISLIQKERIFGWFPLLYIYLDSNPRLKVLRNLSLKSHFEKIKIIFNVESREELISKITDAEAQKGYPGSFRKIPEIKDFVNLDEIATRN